MYEGNTRIGMVHSDDNSQVAFGLYNATDDSSCQDLHYIDDTQDPDIIAFRQNASIYDISRVQCHGTWYINKTSISLLGGSCDLSIKISQDVITRVNYSPYRNGHITYIWTSFPYCRCDSKLALAERDLHCEHGYCVLGESSIYA